MTTKTFSKQEAVKSLSVNRGERPCFAWRINEGCNYRCSYCWYDGEWEKMETVLPPAAQWAESWERMGRRYGAMEIEVLGGEPFLYPGFESLLTAVTQWHHVCVTTNLSASDRQLRSLGSQVDPERLRLAGSYHPQFADFNRFMNKLLSMREYGIYMSMNLVAYPAFLEDLPRYVDRCRREDVKCQVWVFTGRYNGKVYPDSYSEEEKALLKDLIPEGRQAYNLSRSETLGKLCHAGRLYASVGPDGNVYRCGMVVDKEAMGNIFDPAFELLESPAPCPVAYCACSEYRFLDNEMRKTSLKKEIFARAE